MFPQAGTALKQPGNTSSMATCKLSGSEIEKKVTSASGDMVGLPVMGSVPKTSSSISGSVGRKASVTSKLPSSSSNGPGTKKPSGATDNNPTPESNCGNRAASSPAMTPPSLQPMTTGARPVFV